MIARWGELVRFAAVGASGYAVNLATYAFLVHEAGLDYRGAAVIAFLVAVTNNFVLNRQWTFGAARSGAVRAQAIRFLVVSVSVFGVQLGLLTALVDGAAVAPVVGQAIAIACCTPISYVGNKRWSFRAAQLAA